MVSAQNHKIQDSFQVSQSTCVAHSQTESLLKTIHPHVSNPISQTGSTAIMRVMRGVPISSVLDMTSSPGSGETA